MLVSSSNPAKLRVKSEMSQLTLVFPKHAALLSPDEIYEKVDQELLAVFKEDRRLERKPAGTHFDALGDYFAMWANTLPEGGLLVVGMENDGSFSGCHRLSQNQLNEIEKCHQTFCPDARVGPVRGVFFIAWVVVSFPVLFIVARLVAHPVVTALLLTAVLGTAALWIWGWSGLLVVCLLVWLFTIFLKLFRRDKKQTAPPE
jgi:hypothetical protein